MLVAHSCYLSICLVKPLHHSLHHFVNTEAEKLPQDFNFYFCTLEVLFLNLALSTGRFSKTGLTSREALCTESVSVGHSATLPHFKH